MAVECFFEHDAPATHVMPQTCCGFDTFLCDTHTDVAKGFMNAVIRVFDGITNCTQCGAHPEARGLLDGLRPV